MKQHFLFERPAVDQDFDQNVERHRYRLIDVDIGDITFAPGQSESIHRWYRLTPSFAPALVRYFLKEFNVGPDSLVLDPFSGRGTTAIECQKHGIPATAFEINPLLQTVGAKSLSWCSNSDSLLQEYLTLLRAQIERFSGASLETTMKALAIPLPDIHDVFRWWQRDVLRDLLIAKSCAGDQRFSSVAHLLWVALASKSLDCANIHRNHPTITFDDDHGRSIDVYSEIRAAINQIASDLNSLTPAQLKASELCTVVLADSCSSDFSSHFPSRSPTHIITSPPYPNRYSYVHQTRPQMHFMDAVRTRACATEIDLKAIGGTWGRATSVLMKRLIEPAEPLRAALSYWDRLSSKSLLMCNYATKYFIDLDRHICALRKTVAPGAVCAYVVGNSRLSGVEIYTETILAQIFEIHGFSVENIIVFRKRGGRQRLYETAVVVKA